MITRNSRIITASFCLNEMNCKKEAVFLQEKAWALASIFLDMHADSQYIPWHACRFLQAVCDYSVLVLALFECIHFTLCKRHYTCSTYRLFDFCKLLDLSSLHITYKKQAHSGDVKQQKHCANHFSCEHAYTVGGRQQTWGHNILSETPCQLWSTEACTVITTTL